MIEADGTIGRSENRILLHRFNGTESYRFPCGVMSAQESRRGVTLWFEVAGDVDGAQRCSDTEAFLEAPVAAAAIELERLDADLLVGRVFVIPGPLSDEEDASRSSLYYFEHGPLWHNRIAVMSRRDDCLRLRWTAVAPDVSFYDGSKPPTLVEIEGEFRFETAMQRSPARDANEP